MAGWDPRSGLVVLLTQFFLMATSVSPEDDADLGRYKLVECIPLAVKGPVTPFPTILGQNAFRWHHVSQEENPPNSS